MPKSLFIFSGNIGQTPQLKYQPGNERSSGQPRPLLSFTVKYDRLVKSQQLSPQGQSIYEDKGGFWVRVDYWKRNGEQLSKLLAKGMQVQITGELRIDSWEDKDNPGQMLTGMAMTADSIAILPARIESVTMTTPRPQSTAPGQQGSSQAPNYGQVPDYSDIPDFDNYPV